jgi:acetyl esterase/lipase
MLVATARGKDMNDLVERADAKKSRLSPALQALLARTARQHVSLVVDHVDQLLKDAPGNLADVLTSDASCGSIAFSLGSDDLHVQLGVATAKADSARDAVRKITRGKALAGATLRALDDKRADDLGDILARARVVAKGTTVTLEADISYGTLRDLAGYIATALHPLIERATRTVLSIPIWGPEQPPAKDALEVEEVRDVAYWDDPTADPIRHRLDLFLPKGKKDYPVVVLVHGGGWVMGDNRCCGLYSSVGHFLASRGIGAVLPNYRLSPWVTHPGHVEDVARAVRWTRDHIAEHGGDPARLYLIGHSAGGHLVSLLAADEKYLTAEKMSLRDIKGVVTVSGVYRIAADPMEIFLGGSGTQSFRPDQMLPLRGDSGRLPILPPLGFSVNHDSFGSAFGSDPKARADASPLTHVHRGLPPFLILTAESDLPTVSGMAEEFHKALKDAGCEARLLKVEKRNHSSLMFSAIRPDDTAARAILEFVR